MDIYMAAGVKCRWSRRAHVGNPCRFRPTTRPSVATPARRTDPISAGAVFYRREMVPGQKGDVCWSHGGLGGRPAPENQGRDLGVQGAYSGTRGALLKIPLRSFDGEGIAASNNRARFPKKSLFFEKQAP